MKYPQIRKNLLHWYHSNARDLPWRRTREPYKIWVSEIMLQQTQVKTVIPYYEKWMKRFPSVKSLAEADLSDVLKYWAGLGYYRRARMLHQAAKLITQKYDGRMPDSIQELLSVPGIGKYTAGAVASIAFGKPEPVLDGNVKRILARILAIHEAVDTPSGEKKLWEIARSLVGTVLKGTGLKRSDSNLSRTKNRLSTLPSKHNKIAQRTGSSPSLPGPSPGDFNQALMELGATVCFPENPQCPQCPVQKLCSAHRFKRETFFPVKKQKELTEKISSSALILRENGKVLIQRQRENGRWGGLWMFPFGKDKKSMLKNFSLKNDGRAVSLTHRMTIRHGFTKYRVKLDVYEAQIKSPRHQVTRSPEKNGTGSAFTGDWKLVTGDLTMHWVKIGELENYAFPSPHQKIVKELVDHHG